MSKHVDDNTRTTLNVQTYERQHPHNTKCPNMSKTNIQTTLNVQTSQRQHPNNIKCPNISTTTPKQHLSIADLIRMTRWVDARHCSVVENHYENPPPPPGSNPRSPLFMLATTPQAKRQTSEKRKIYNISTTNIRETLNIQYINDKYSNIQTTLYAHTA